MHNPAACEAHTQLLNAKRPHTTAADQAPPHYCSSPAPDRSLIVNVCTAAVYGLIDMVDTRWNLQSKVERDTARLQRAAELKPKVSSEHLICPHVLYSLIAFPMPISSGRASPEPNQVPYAKLNPCATACCTTQVPNP
eukprot:366573-Chlamydomonas_euryale.AAC.44